MTRFEDTDGLFGEEQPMGTVEEITCQFCGKKYLADADKTTLYYEDFAGLEVLGCCFEEIEAEILQRMPQILAWYVRILGSQRLKLEAKETQVRKLLELIQELPSGSPVFPE